MARLPDLTPLDFCQWGISKDKIYSAKLCSIAELKEQIQDVIAQVLVEMCTKVYCLVPERLAKCIKLHGELTKL